MRSRVSQKPQYMPHVRFNDTSGTPQDFTSTTSADPAKWPIGMRLKVVFALEAPRKAMIGVPLLFWRGRPACSSSLWGCCLLGSK